MPYTPVSAIVLKCLLRTSKRLFVFLLNSVAVSDISPGLSVLFLDRDHITERKDRLVELLETHVSAPAGEPVVATERIDLERFSEALN